MRSRQAPHQNAGQRGIALVAVLGFLAAMSLIVISVIATSRSTVNTATRQLSRLQAQAAIESAIDLAANSIAAARGTVPQLLKAPQVVEIGGFRVKLSVRPERGKVDVNFADQILLEAVFRSAGAGDEKAQALAAAVEDWRDSDDLVHLNGAEQRQYRDAGLHYGPANKYFDTIAELNLVLGMTDDILECLRPELTYLTQSPGVDISSANPKLQRELGVEQTNAEVSPLAASLASGQLISPGDIYEVSAELSDDTKKIRRGERVSIRITGNDDDPYWILSIEPLFPLIEKSKRACQASGADGTGS